MYARLHSLYSTESKMKCHVPTIVKYFVYRGKHTGTTILPVRSYNVNVRVNEIVMGTLCEESFLNRLSFEISVVLHFAGK